jgi:hypothetical protein
MDAAELLADGSAAAGERGSLWISGSRPSAGAWSMPGIDEATAR